MHLTTVTLARLNILLHLVGLALAAAFIAPGTPLAPLDERRTYLGSWPAGWIIAWIAWIGCAAAMVAFSAAVGRRFVSPLARVGVMIAVAAAAVDVTCDASFIAVLPSLAADATAAEPFVRAERWTSFGSLFVANGLYSISTLVLTLALRRVPGSPASLTVIGVAVFVFGMLLSAAGVTGVPEHAIWATGPTIGSYCLWVYLVARSPTVLGERP